MLDTLCFDGGQLDLSSVVFVEEREVGNRGVGEHREGERCVCVCERCSRPSRPNSQGVTGSFLVCQCMADEQEAQITDAH